MTIGLKSKKLLVLLIPITQNLILSIRIRLGFNTKNYAKSSLIFGATLQPVCTVRHIHKAGNGTSFIQTKGKNLKSLCGKASVQNSKVDTML